MPFGYGDYVYELDEGWGTLPDGWVFGQIPAVACDSEDRVYVYSRSAHPLVIFDRDGNFLDSWGEGILKDAHGIYIDGEDNVYCAERDNHAVFKFNPKGELVMTLGTPGKPGPWNKPFNVPTDVAILESGELLVSDGYENRCVHYFSPEGEWLRSFGDDGTGPGEFKLVHTVRVDRYNRIWICDRDNRRIQIFDADGQFITEWKDLPQPDNIYFDTEDDVVYIAELEQEVSIYTFDQELLSQWGGRQLSDKPGEFCGAAHGIWLDSRGDMYVGQVWTDGPLQKFIRQ